MKYRFIILILFLNSCASSYSGSLKSNQFIPYSSKGFALIYQDSDYDNKVISKKLDNNNLELAHRKLDRNKIVVLTNPENNKSLQLKITKKAKYPNFFNLVVSKKVADELNLNPEFPYVELYERTKNKSFVAKKAEIFKEETNVMDKAPVEKITINNISKTRQSKSKKIKRFSIIVGEFYSIKTANSLKDSLADKHVKKELLKVKNLGKNRFELSSGPYRSINTLKNDYFALNKYGFEDLDIKQND